MKLDREAIPHHFTIIVNHYGEFALCPICQRPCIQTSPEYLACEVWEHTGLIRHAGSVTQSWALLHLWRLCETLPKARLHSKSRWSLDLPGPAGRLLYRWVPGTLRCINGEWLPPNEPPLPPADALLAVCKFRGQVGPRYFVPLPQTKGLDNATPKKHRGSRSARSTARSVRQSHAGRGEPLGDTGSRW